MRCTRVQSAVLRSHVVCLSVLPSVCEDCDHIGWNSSEIISPLVSLGCSLSADPNTMGLLQGKHPEILAQSDPPPVHLIVGDIRSQIAAEWLQTAQRSQCRAYRKPPSLCRMVPSLTPYDFPFPQNDGFHMPPRYANGHISATGDPIHFMFGSRVWVGGLNGAISGYIKSKMAAGRPPSWIISNGHISATAHSIRLYSAHRAVIFAIAQLSCFTFARKFHRLVSYRDVKNLLSRRITLV